MKKFIRRVAAVGMGTAMLAGTFGGALAAGETLADLPAPFVVNEAYADVAMVVGSLAGTNDNAARSALKTYFDGEATAVAGDAAISDGYSKEFYYEVNFSDSTAFGSEVDDEKVSTLMDGKIDWGDKSYDIKEVINFTGGAEVSTSVNTSGMKDLGADPYLTFGGGTVKYLYKFDDQWKSNDTSSQNLGTSTALEIDFLGTNVEITDVSTTANTVTLQLSQEYKFVEGETQVVDGETISVGSIFSGSVEVTSESETKIINSGSSYDFGDVTVKVDTIGYNSDHPELSKVILLIGSKISDTVKTGEVFELFTDYTPDNDAPWEWVIQSGGPNDNNSWIDHIGVSLRLSADDLDITDTDPNPDPVAVGESFVFPNNHVAISFDETTDTSYCTITVEAKSDKDINTSASGSANGDNTAYLEFKGDQNNCFQTSGGKDTDTIYALRRNDSIGRWDIWYDNNDGVKTNDTDKNSNTTFKIDWDDTILNVFFMNASSSNHQYVNISKDTNAESRDQHIYLNVSGGFQEFGTTDDFDSGKREVFYGLSPQTTATRVDLSGRDYQALTMYGFVIGGDGSNIEDDLDANKVIISVPNNRAQAVVTMGADSQVTGGAVVEPALVNDAGAAGYNNLILVGGPCVNELTAEYLSLDFPTCEGASGILENKAIVQLVESGGKTALIVAGWDAADTKKAADTVAAGGLTGGVDTPIIVE